MTSFPSLVPYGWNDRWRALLSDLGPDVEPGRVLRHNGSALQVVAADGTRSAPLGPALDPPPVVGDWVALDGDTPVAVLARTSLLRRRTAIGEHEHPLVANIDAVLIVCGLDRPVKAGRIQRVAALAWDAGAVPTVVLTKADLLDDVSPVIERGGRRQPGAHRDGGVHPHRRRSRRPASAAHRHHGHPHRRVGGGKSSLVNALTDDDPVATGAVRDGDAKGRHTTTARSLHLLRHGGVLVDTPGIRAVGLWIDPDAVTTTFADVDTIAESCRFADCQHEDQPGCAVREAVDGGQLAEERLTSWAGPRPGGRRRCSAGRRPGPAGPRTPVQPGRPGCATPQAATRVSAVTGDVCGLTPRSVVSTPLPMTLSYDDAPAGSRRPASGSRPPRSRSAAITYTVFRNAPPSLRELFATRPAAGRRDVPRLRGRALELRRASWPQVDALGAALVDRYGVQQGRPGRHRHAQLPGVGHRASRRSPRSAPSSVSLNAWWTEDELDYALEDSRRDAC